MDTIDNKIADSLSRILDDWNPVTHDGEYTVENFIDLKRAIKYEIEWLRS